MYMVFHSMPTMWSVLWILVASTLASTDLRHQPFADAIRKAGTSDSNRIVVDLGYAVYEGHVDPTTNLTVWQGIRFAASAAGNNRWQAPQVPEVNRSSVILADEVGPVCPQTQHALGTPSGTGVTGSEDCLFLNVYAPSDASKLPVLVWIHGGGYGGGDGRQDLSAIINANNNTFVAIAIQYRLGAFGFLSSQEIYKSGVTNAGILDQILALQWVQAYIKKFGGDPSRVTISGESAGGGAVMLLDMAYGGTLNTTLFVNSIAASPYLPMQHVYNDPLPTYQYDQFAWQAGCGLASSSFECLISASTETLQNASSYVTSATLYGDWAFLPVTDGNLIQDLPSRQLQARKVNGLHMLTGNNANEASIFTPTNITTEADLVSWLQLTFPSFSNAKIQAVLNTYPLPDTNLNPDAILYATDGTHPPTAITQSSLATGHQQRANNIYAETTFVCPSYWLGEAYSTHPTYNLPFSLPPHHTSYKYQYSVIPGIHGQDVPAYFDPPSTLHSSDFSQAFKSIWGNFVTTNDPSISNLIANGVSTGNSSLNDASAWPVFAEKDGYPMVNLNESFVGGVATGNEISLVDGWEWEGGRGARCELWREMGPNVPER